MQQPIFSDQSIYHIYNRGTEKRNVFLDKLDYLRFIHDLFEFNDSNQASPSNARFRLRNPGAAKQEHVSKCLEVKPLNIPLNISSTSNTTRRRKLLVEILAFSQMPNHYHVLLRQLQENGIVKFMQKLGTGYTMYFNLKYKRTGGLFQGTYKAVPIEHDRQLLHLPYYIHLNPLDLKYPGWREKGVPSYKNAIKYIETYRWSSYLDYIGKRNFPSVTQRDFLLKFFGEGRHQKDIKRWLKEREQNCRAIEDLMLE